MFDLTNAKRPEIDGVKYDYVYAYDGSETIKLENVFVYDLNSYPSIISEPVKAGVHFNMVDIAHSLLFMAGREDDSGDLQPFLLEDTQVVELISSVSMFAIFPTMAKFGLRKLTATTPK